LFKGGRTGSALRDDLEPVAVGIFNEVDAHGGGFKADAAHFLVQGVRGFKIVRLKGDMAFIVAQVVGLVVPEPGQLQLEAGAAVLQELDDEAAVFGGGAAGPFQAQGLFIEGDAAVQVKHIQVAVQKTERHGGNPPLSGLHNSRND